MKSLVASLVTALLVTVGAFYGLVHVVGLERNTAAQIAAATIGAVPYIREILKRTFPIQRSSSGAPVVPLGDYGLPPQRMILYGTLVVAGAMEFGPGLGALGADALGATRDHQRLYIVAIVSYLILVPIIFSVGRWVGRRSTAHALAVIVLISFLARLGVTLLDLSLMGSAGMKEFFGFEFTLGTLSLSVAGGTVLFFLIGLVGYWQGRRQRLAAYLTYLLQSVSEDARKAIVDLAFEEARPTLRRGASTSRGGDQAGRSA